VADETDFVDLYARLRLQPGCTLAEFKQAYRRHVAQWHPDRTRDGHADAPATRRLQRLTRQYSAAMAFQRRHGRLPGAPLPERGAPVVPEPLATVAAGVPEATLRFAAAWLPTRTPGTRWWLLIGLVGVAVAIGSLMPATDRLQGDGETAGAYERAPRVDAPRPARMPDLSLGVDEDQVLALEGEPDRRIDDRWEYGPSWIRFDRHRVGDWYSSPLRGLHAASSRPRR
jgi:hypothetical protein